MKRFLKITGLVILSVILIISGVIISGMIYQKHDLRLERSAFPDVISEADIDNLAQELLYQMDLDEKLRQLSGDEPVTVYSRLIGMFMFRDQFPHIFSGRNKRLGIPPFVLSDGPRGAVVGTGNTSFPVAMARGATWDTDLERRVGNAMAIELRANNTNYIAAPCINLLRHPAWGRAQETYGEDPWLLGEMGLAMVEGIQRHNVMACVKHFAVNSIENSRFYLDVDMDERTLREVYLPHFKKVVQEGNIASVMSSYNKFRGDYCGHSHYLLTRILRDEWQFEGFVSSDWVWGLRDGVAGVNAGMDVEMPARRYYSKRNISRALDNKEITMEQIDMMVLRVLKTKLKYAYREDIMVYDESVKAGRQHTELAREVAEKSMVLVKNEGVLPFDPAAIKKVAVIGRLANVENTGDRGSSHVRTPYVVTPWQGISSYVASYGGSAIYSDGSDIEEARKLASSADAVVLIVGFTHEDEGEYIVGNPEKQRELGGPPGGFVSGGDRPDLRLKTRDEEMIKAIAGTNPNIVVIYTGGSAITMEGWRSSMPAILFSWYAGMEGGNALAAILFGEVNPGGKLPFTIPVDENDLPWFDPWVDTITYGYYHGYTLFDKKDFKAAYRFGHGLSYTSFMYDSLTVENPLPGDGENIRIRIRVKNTGDRQGDEVVQLYTGFSGSSADRPVKLLRGFKRVSLLPDESLTVTFEVEQDKLAMYDPEPGEWVIEKMNYMVYSGGSSDTDNLLESEFELR